MVSKAIDRYLRHPRGEAVPSTTPQKWIALAQADHILGSLASPSGFAREFKFTESSSRLVGLKHIDTHITKDCSTAARLRQEHTALNRLSDSSVHKVYTT